MLRHLETRFIHYNVYIERNGEESTLNHVSKFEADKNMERREAGIKGKGEKKEGEGG